MGMMQKPPWALILLQSVVSVLIGVVLVMVNDNRKAMDDLSKRISLIRESQLINEGHISENTTRIRMLEARPCK